MARPSQNFAGERYGKWLILDESKHINDKIRWKARCDCGTEKFINAYDAARGRTKSCGCNHFRKGKDHPSYKHGKSIAKGQEYIDYKHGKRIERQFGITAEGYQNMLDAQNGVCAICKKPETATRLGTTIKMPVDHCHKTGKVRGLLCDSCNKGLGQFLDDPDALRSAADYLEKFKE
jgi:hypothetical protein